MAKARRVLVCGAGFAGLATAFWMERRGYEVTIVEIAPALRRGGTPVDIKKGTIDIVRRMGLLDAIRAAGLPPRRMEFMNADDTTQAVMTPEPFERDGPDEQYEIERGDLLDILSGAIDGKVEIAFGRSVVGLEQGVDRVIAHFADGSAQDFALVFGCDGTRSASRKMVFGDDGAMHFLKKYAFLVVVRQRMIEPDTTQYFTATGCSIILNGYRDKTDIGLGFHAERELAYDHRDKAAIKRLVRERLEGAGWRAPELLEAVDAADDFYFDGIYQIRMSAWSKGRFALVGDAGYCPSPFAGMGGSMALVGASALGDAFARHGDDHVAAFQDYDATLRPFVEAVQDEAEGFGETMFAPATDAAMAQRDAMLEHMRGGAAALERSKPSFERG